MSPELQQRIMNRLTVRMGDTFDLGQLRSELQAYRRAPRINYISICPCDPDRPNLILNIMLQQYVERWTRSLCRRCRRVFTRSAEASAPPSRLSGLEPGYSEEARVAKWQGAVLLQVVIDESGVPQDIQVVRPLGLGLDQKAIEAVQKWRFKPGTRTGSRYLSPPTWRSTFACCNRLSWAPAHRPFREL